MLRALLRLVLSILGAGLSAFVVAGIEARTVAAALAESRAATPALIAAELGILLPAALLVGGAVGFALLVLEPEGPTSPWDHLAELRGGPVLARLRKAAVAPLVVVGIYAWTLGSAYAARSVLAVGRPPESGLSVGVASIGLLLAVLASAAALLPVVRRLIAVGSSSAPALLDPALTGGVALVVVVLFFAVSISTGDTSGGGGVMGIFGVLKREELDLRPVANAALLAAGAYFAPIAFSRAPATGWTPRPPAFVGAGLSALVFVLLAALCGRAASSLEHDPGTAAAIEKHAPLGKVSLALLRRATDKDKDGFSGRFGGGDCDDLNPRVNPSAVDVPGNGIDEDCSGADTPAVIEPEHDVGRADAGPKTRKRSYNVLLITVDTLRVDLGFMGYPKPVSPNLDALAEKSTVFERAYSMASYTGKSVGPMLIGRYPSETQRDWSHFNTYAPSNVFVTERVHDTGVRTFAGHCHWYFRFPTGLRQGFDVWNTSAIPPGMGDNDNSITSDRMSDLALQLLGDPANTTPGAPPPDTLDLDEDGGAPPPLQPIDAGTVTGGDGQKRFFGWFHYFDPHAQYVAHEGAPTFTGPYPGKNLYDQEVWFTDKHIGRVLDHIAQQPWAADTAIVVTADHGEAFAEHNMSWHGQEIFESLVRVPLVVYVPGEKPRRVPVKRSHIDVAPTILDLMGLDPSPDADDPAHALRGQSLLEDVLLPEGKEHEERDVYIDMPPGPFNTLRRGVITGPTPGMKLIHQGGGMYQLYDLANDPGELKDLAGNREMLKPMIDKLQAIRARLKEIEVKPEEK